MDPVGLLIFLGIGLLAGWLAGMILKGRGFGLLWNLLIGVAGSFVGGWIFSILHISIMSALATRIIAAIAGAIVILAIVNLIKRK